MTANDTTALKRTPLYAEHKALGARLVEFSGWEMPVQYSSIIDEHNAVRTHAGLFDVSHMGEFKASGADALAFLQYLVPNDVSKLVIGQALYTQLCKPDAGVIDDLLIYHLSDDDYMLVVNAGNIDTDYAWVEQQSKNFPNLHLANQSDTTALLALQGPLAQGILQSLTEVDLASIGYYHFETGLVDGVNCIISRTGYTGEDGFELYFAPLDAPKLWNDLLAAGEPQGILPAGLGARDTLR
ncbi:MAG TPA: glycine cleavage system aminomethyltransferase GcvT, partial [Ktedonobacteraceae bacterium]|nr:glycine cleavage system aminomethyltransferase GcvT [Ktedonobacteraceae bacterium]